ncbi:hemerythrin domain-containing protein [Ideonella livida]|uniref:Hemerythrin domain-containing protein n=1 Tax=Ideonella livida TaxID=2707176 RepID=A0A7C9PFC3_9BURK|nr:hemerythrin domain-containing protein [Ideonella livida]NDY90517.1 hemerythrin domain-containing protein [Ideonella livida]
MSTAKNRPARPAVPDLPPLEALEQTHRQVMRVLAELATLVDTLAEEGVTPPVQAKARQIAQFFEQEARAHHAQEDLHVFPSLLESTDATLVAHVQRLQQDHGWLEEDWIELGPQMDALARGYSWYDLDALRHGIQVFTELYQEHIALEESLIYPEARRRLAQADAEADARRTQLVMAV